MAVLTVAAFISKWGTTNFPSTGLRAITGAKMREFKDDIADSFQSVLGAVTITSWKSPCVVATTANITLSGEQTIDGVLTSASRVLVKSQTSTLQNGIYVSSAGAWSRATDADSAAELEGAAVSVTQGTTNQNTIWSQTTDSITLGSSAIAWQQVGYATTGLGGSTGSTDNAVLRADGTGGSTAQSSSLVVNDNGDISNSSAFTISDASGAIISFEGDGTLDVRSNGGAAGFIIQDTPERILFSGDMGYDKVLTSAGTTGDRTINATSGSVNFAAAATSLTVTNSLVASTSLVFCTIRTNDSTAQIKNVVPGSGSFVINLAAACTAETSVGFFVTN